MQADDAIDDAHPVNVRTTVKLLNPQALERSLFMADDELRVVDQLDVDEIRRCVDRYSTLNRLPGFENKSFPFGIG